MRDKAVDVPLALGALNLEKPAVTKECVRGGISPAEIAVHISGVSSTSLGEHCLTEEAPHTAYLLFILEPNLPIYQVSECGILGQQPYLLESCEGVSGEDLGPLVGVVTSGVPTFQEGINHKEGVRAADESPPKMCMNEHRNRSSGSGGSTVNFSPIDCMICGCTDQNKVTSEPLKSRFHLEWGARVGGWIISVVELHIHGPEVELAQHHHA